MSKIMTFAAFKKAVGEDIVFFKGKGRAFAPTSVGTLFVATSYNPSKDGFVVEAKEIPGRPELDGSLWLCNAKLTVYDIKSHKPPAKTKKEE